MGEVVLLAFGLLVLVLGGLVAVDMVRWQRVEREKRRIQAERLTAEARLTAVTHAAMQQMYEAARQAQRDRRP